MKPVFIRRFRRRSSPAKNEGSFFKKDSQETFFGGAEHESFFQPASAAVPAKAVQRKCEDCDKEDKKLQREPEKKEEETVQRAPEKKEDEKLQRAEDKKEEKKKEEPIQRAPEKKEEEKLQRVEAKKEEDKIRRVEDKKEKDTIQREPEKKEEDKVQKAEDKKEEDKTVQKKESPAVTSSGKSSASYIRSINGKGQPLPAAANYFFSSRMGYDFSNVKIHTDKEAAESAKGINAKAYTTGKNIVFNDGQYNMLNGEGKKLMAHELTHVIQQAGVSPSIQRDPVVDAGVPVPAGVPQKSPLGQEMEKIWYEKGKAAFIQRLRSLTPDQYNDTDTFVFILDNLTGDEQWLASNLLAWGPEANWDFTTRLELEVRSLPQSRGFAGVAAILKTADASQKAKVLRFQLPLLKSKLTNEEFAKVIVSLDIVNLVKGIGDAGRQWILSDATLMILLQQALTAQDYLSVATELFNLSFLPAGKIRDATYLLYFSSEAVDRNTAKRLINGEIRCYYMEDLKQPADMTATVKNAGLDAAVYNAFFIPPENKSLLYAQKNASGFPSPDNTKLFGKKSDTLDFWKSILTHEINHILNNDNSKAEGSFERYKGEFRAYWLSVFRNVADPDARALKIKEHILNTYPAYKTKYDSDAAFKAQVDGYKRPEGNLTN